MITKYKVEDASLRVGRVQEVAVIKDSKVIIFVIIMVSLERGKQLVIRKG